jgi:hypothetical protein
MIAVALLLPCKNFNVANYSNILKVINMNLGILAYHNKVVKTRGIILKAIILELYPFLA